MKNRLSAFARLRVIAIAGVALLTLGGATFLPIEGAVAAVTTKTINFEDVIIPDDDYVDANIYTAQGITIEGAFGIVRDAADLSDWGLLGTDGPQFLGQNHRNDVTITFAEPINGFQIDCSASFGHTDGSGIAITGFSDLAVVDTTSGTFAAVNTWTTFSLSGSGIKTVTLVSPNNGYDWGCDRMILTTGTPDPTTTSTTSTTSTTTTQPSATDPAKPAFTG